MGKPNDDARRVLLSRNDWWVVGSALYILAALPAILVAEAIGIEPLPFRVFQMLAALVGTLALLTRPRSVFDTPAARRWPLAISLSFVVTAGYLTLLVVSAFYFDVMRDGQMPP